MSVDLVSDATYTSPAQFRVEETISYKEVCMSKNASIALSLTLALSAAAYADAYKDPEEVLLGIIEKSDSKYLTQSEQNLMMMSDNPAYWTVEEGEELFKEKRGPKKASLESCDFGKGPGVLEGAYVEMPRYFKDTGKVMDLETRLVHCMKTI